MPWLQGKAFFLERFSNDSRSILFYTGFKDYATLKAVFYAIQPCSHNGSVDQNTASLGLQ